MLTEWEINDKTFKVRQKSSWFICFQVLNKIFPNNNGFLSQKLSLFQLFLLSRVEEFMNVEIRIYVISIPFSFTFSNANRA